MGQGASQSGQERDHLFMSCGGREFHDLGGLLGVDDIGDARTAAFLDFDRDGRLDIALTNANAPRLRLYRNELARGGFVALRFVGGAGEGGAAGAAAERWSNRDGVGARVTVTLPGGRRLVREHTRGEGFGGHNAATLLVGLGEHARAERVELRWPSGRTQSAEGVAAGTLLTAFEDARRGPGGEAFAREAWVREAAVREAAVREAAVARAASAGGAAGEGEGELPAALRKRAVAPAGGLAVITTFATWCEVCRAETASTRALRAALPEGEVALYGVPMDAADDATKIQAWVEAHRPAYDVVDALGPEDVEAVRALLVARLRKDALPSTVVADAAGRVLAARFGLPSVSELRRLHAAATAR